MGIRSPFDADSSSSHIVDKMIGNAYPVVRAVYGKLDEIAYVAENSEAILEAGNAALNAIEGLQELGTQNGSSHIGHIASGAGSVPTTVQDKLREVVSVSDKGAAPSATEAVNTAAFLAAGAGAYVPAGDFYVNAAAVDLSLYHGPGIILYAGQRISLSGAAMAPKLAQKQVLELALGFDNGTVDTQVFSGARRAPQGLAHVTVDGVEKFFTTQKTRGTSYTADERCRIVEFNANSGLPVAWSHEIQLGHGQDLTALVEDGEVFLYTSHPTETFAELPLSGYDIYICAGQSNMVGYGTGVTGADTTSIFIDQYAMSGPSEGTVVQASDPLLYPTTLGDTVSPASQFAREMLATLAAGRKILLLPVAVHATSLVYGERKWAPGGSLFEQAVAVANAALALSPNNRIAGMLWSQGETDRFEDGITSAEFLSATVAMLSSMRDRLGANFPIVVSGLNPDYDAGDQQDSWDQIQLALTAVPSNLLNSAYVPVPAGYSVVGDEIHITAVGNRLRGTAFGTAMKTLAAPPVTLGGVHAGKGISKIQWRGSLTNQSDLTSYKLLGQIGTNHPLSLYRKATPCVSTDGKHIILVCHESDVVISADSEGSEDNARTVLVFDRNEVESAGNSLNVQPVRVFRLPRPQPALTEEHITQGVCADSKYIYTLGGYYQPRGWQVITITDYSGNLIRRIPVVSARAEYGLDGLLNHPTLGTPVGMEVEGLTLRGSELSWLTTDVWRANSNVVTFEGANYACIIENSNHYPFEFRYWTPTNKPATHGEWNATTLYSSGSYYTRQTKRIYSLVQPTGAAGEQALDAGLFSYSTGATLYGGQNSVDMAFQRGGAFKVSAYDPQNNSYRSAMGHHSQRRLQVHDHRYGSNVDKYTALQRNSEPTRDYSTLFATNASYSAGAWLSLYGDGDNAFAGDIRLGYGDTQAKFIFSAAGAIRCGTADTQDIGTTATKWRVGNFNSIRLGSSGQSPLITSFIGSPEGHVVAPVGSLCINSADMSQYWKISGTNDTGWAQQSIGLPDRHKMFRKRIAKRLPIKFPDYTAIVENYGYAWIFPQCFALDETANEVFVVFSPNGPIAIPRKWVAVFDWTTGNYKKCFAVSTVVGGEGCVIKYAGASRFLYIKENDSGSVNGLGKYDITTLPTNMAVLTPVELLPVSLSLQFTERNGTFMAEQGVPSIATVADYTVFNLYNETFEVIGAVQFDKVDTGYKIKTDSTYGPYIPKRQNIALGDGAIFSIHGGNWNVGAALSYYSYTGPKVYNLNGERVAEGIMRPDKMAEILIANGIACARIEHEGIVVGEGGKVYTLCVHKNVSSSNAAVDGIIIFEEFSTAPDSIDFSPAAAHYPTFNRRHIESGMWPRSSIGGSVGGLIDPLNGMVITTLEGLCDFMVGAGIETTSFYTSSVTVSDIGGEPIASGNMVTLRNCNNSTFFMTWHGLAGGTREYQINGVSGSRTKTSMSSGASMRSSVTPQDNNDMLIELSSNTQLTFKVKGSDGIIRSFNATLA